MIKGKSDNKNFFIQVPTEFRGHHILDSHKALNSTDKLVFGEIYTMLRATGYFYMSNSEFANRIGKSEPSIIKSLKKLKKNDLITFKNVKKNGQIIGRSIYFGGHPSNHRGYYSKFGGHPSKLSGHYSNPNISDNISKNRSSEHQPKLNGKQKKIKTYLIEHFPKFNSIIKIQNLDDAIITWTGTYPLENIRKAIERTVNYQMKHGLINVPTAFISKTLQNITYSKESVKPKRHPAEHVSTVDDLMARERKNAEKSDEKFLNQLKDRKGVK